MHKFHVTLFVEPELLVHTCMLYPATTRDRAANFCELHAAFIACVASFCAIFAIFEIIAYCNTGLVHFEAYVQAVLHLSGKGGDFSLTLLKGQSGTQQEH